jgi:putative ABC transport system ATP-binding protein
VSKSCPSSVRGHASLAVLLAQVFGIKRLCRHDLGTRLVFPYGARSPGKCSGTPMLMMSNLSKVYRTEFLETFALRDFSINVKEGEFVSITGPSGSGKTTFLNVAGILEEFTSGEYLLDGVNVHNMSDDQRSRLRNEKIGFIFQAFNQILDLNVFANVELPLHYRRLSAAQRKAQVTDALHRVGLSARSKPYPGELSGGQQQRVAIARALAGNPRILLAAEPTGNLDSQTARGVMRLIEDLHRQGATIVLVTHDPQIAARAQRQIHIVDGQIVPLEQLPRTGLSQLAASITTDPTPALNPKPWTA